MKYVLMIVLLLSMGVFADVSNVPDFVKSKLHPSVAKFVDSESSVDVLVQFDSNSDISILGCDVKYVSKRMSLVSAVCQGKSLKSIANRKNVRFVWEDEQFSLPLDVSVGNIGASDVWDLGFNGSGVVIALLDSGVNSSHHALAGKILLSEDFTVENDTEDTCNHGTRTASILVSNNETYRGVAPGASLLNGKVGRHIVTGQCGASSTDIIEGIDWAVENGADVIMLNVGAGIFNCSLSITANYVNETVISDNISIVIPAGNGGPSNVTIWTPGCAENAITVGAVDKSNVIASFSSRGYVLDTVNRVKPDLVAPGVGINSADAFNGFDGASGTSFSSPHVAGVVALMLQANQFLGQDVIKSILKNTSVDLGYDENTQGEGLVNASAAVNLSLELLPPPPNFTNYPGLLIYHSGNSSLKFRDVFGNDSFSVENSSLDAANSNWVRVASSPAKDENLVVSLTNSSSVVAQIHSSSGFSNNYTIISNAGGFSTRRFDVAYGVDGKALVVFANGSNSPGYVVWNGSIFSELGSFASSSCGNDVAWIELESKPNSSEMIAVFVNSSGSYCGQVWNGSSWGDDNLFGSDIGVTTQKFDVAFEKSGDALVVFESSNAGKLHYCTWTGSWCSASVLIADRGAQNEWVVLASDSSSDRILVGAYQPGDKDVDVVEWNGSSFGSWKIIDGCVEGGSTAEKVFDVSFVGDSGVGLFVYVDSNFKVPSFATCSNASDCFGGSWSVPSVTTNSSNDCGEVSDLAFVSLFSDPLSDKILLTGASQASHYKCAQFYDGSWGSWFSSLGSGAVGSGEDISAVFDKI